MWFACRYPGVKLFADNISEFIMLKQVVSWSYSHFSRFGIKGNYIQGCWLVQVSIGSLLVFILDCLAFGAGILNRVNVFFYFIHPIYELGIIYSLIIIISPFFYFSVEEDPNRPGQPGPLYPGWPGNDYRTFLAVYLPIINKFSWGRALVLR